jgi:hypothetical protein
LFRNTKLKPHERLAELDYVTVTQQSWFSDFKPVDLIAVPQDSAAQQLQLRLSPVEEEFGMFPADSIALSCVDVASIRCSKQIPAFHDRQYHPHVRPVEDRQPASEAVVTIWTVTETPFNPKATGAASNRAHCQADRKEPVTQNKKQCNQQDYS